MNMFTPVTSKVTSKGQVTLPVQLRRMLNLKSGHTVVFSKLNDFFKIEKLPDISSLMGSLANPNVKPITDMQMKKIIEKGLFSDRHDSY